MSNKTNPVQVAYHIPKLRTLAMSYLASSRTPDIDAEKMRDGALPNSQAIIMAQNYEIPKFIKQRLDADMEQAKAAAVITALFAGTLVQLVQLVGHSDGSALVPQVLRWFSYSALLLALTATFLCLTCVRMCSDLPGYAAQLILRDGDSLPARVARGGAIPIELLQNPHELLRSFGGSPRYQSVDLAFEVMFMYGCLCMFTSVVMWIWVNEEGPLAAGVMATALPVVLCVLWSFYPEQGFRSLMRRNKV